MKKLLLLTLFFGVGVGSQSFAQQPRTPDAPVVKADPLPLIPEDKPKRYSPPGGGFSVLMPGKPVAQDEEVDTRLGKVTNHSFSAGAGEVWYAVMYSDLPAPVSDPEVIKGMLDNARAHGLAAVHGELQSEQEITLEGNPGREWLVRIPRGAILQARAYWVRQRLYQVVTLREPEPNKEISKLREAAVKSFLDSFQLLAEEPK